MKTIFVDVDTQRDFVHPLGSLYVDGARALAPIVSALTKAAVRCGAMIVGSVDSHAFDAWEFAGSTEAGPNGERPNFPAHCVKGTEGWLKIAGTLAPRARFVPNVTMRDDELARALTHQAPQQILLEKEVYSLFANPNADAVLERIVGDASTRFVVYGVALDYCVKAAAIGLVDWLARTRREGEVELVRDATASVRAADGRRAMDECVARGVKSVDVRDVLAKME